MEHRLIIKDDLWPNDFKHLFLDSSTDDEIHLRSSISSIEDIGKWISEFGRLTRTQWNLRQSKPTGTYVVCMRKFVCHHSSFHKVDKDRNKKGASKNDGCNASISISVQVYSRRMRKRKNPFMEVGLWSKMRISTIHTHPLDTIDTLRNLQDRNGELRRQFFTYFSNSMCAAEAKNYHECCLKERGSTETDLVDGSQNPKARTVSYWYDEWKKLNCNSSITLASKSPSSENIRKKKKALPKEEMIQVEVGGTLIPIRVQANIEDISINNDGNSIHNLCSLDYEDKNSAHLDDAARVCETILYEVHQPEEEIDVPVSAKSKPFWDIANIPVDGDIPDVGMIEPTEYMTEPKMYRAKHVILYPNHSPDEPSSREGLEDPLRENLIESMCDDLKKKAHSFGIDEELSVAFEKYRECIQNAKSKGQLLNLLHTSVNQANSDVTQD